MFYHTRNITEGVVKTENKPTSFCDGFSYCNFSRMTFLAFKVLLKLNSMFICSTVCVCMNRGTKIYIYVRSYKGHIAFYVRVCCWNSSDDFILCLELFINISFIRTQSISMFHHLFYASAKFLQFYGKSKNYSLDFFEVFI